MKINPSQTVYVVGSSSGKWDDYHYSVKAVFLNKSLAEKYTAKKTAQVTRLKEMLPQKPPEPKPVDSTSKKWQKEWDKYLKEEEKFRTHLMTIGTYTRYHDINNLNNDYSIQEFQTITCVRNPKNQK